MLFDDVVIDVKNLSKRYEIYDTPRDRLKQLVLPQLHQMAKRIGSSLGITQNTPAPTYFQEFWALNDISFQVRRGETVGIIGRNGSGKSTLLQILAGTLTATSGEAIVKGRIAALLELGSGFNPEFTGRENVFMNGRILGLSQKEIEARYDQIVEFADIGEFIDQPVKTYSSGMFVRLAFAVQAHIDASIVIIDEALAVGDVFFTQKCFNRLRELVDSGAAVILVTHDMASVTQFCNRVLVLNKGQQMFQGEAVAAIRRYMALQRDVSASLAQRAQLTQNITESSTPNTAVDLSDWPTSQTFLDTSSSDIVGNGQAELIGVALCDSEGQPAQLFQMGDKAFFYTEYRVLEPIEVPIGGVTIVNEKGILVHGKNSMQYNVDSPELCPKGTTLRFRQQITLDIAPGDYTFIVGLATIDSTSYRNSCYMSHADLSHLTRRVVSVGRAGSFTISLRRDGMSLKHHGIANLPGACVLYVTNSKAEEAP